MSNATDTAETPQPGRKLDRLVHTKVMRGALVYFGDTLINPDTVPHYSTDIAAAWTICEYLNRPTESGGVYQVWVNFDDALVDGGAYLWPLTQGEVALTICLAALKAVGAVT